MSIVSMYLRKMPLRFHGHGSILKWADVLATEQLTPWSGGIPKKRGGENLHRNLILLRRNKSMSLTTSLNCSPVSISSLVIDISSLGPSYPPKSCPRISHQSNSWRLSRFDCCILLLLVILTTVVADANPKLSLSLSLLLLFPCLSPTAPVVVNRNVVSAGHDCLSIGASLPPFSHPSSSSLSYLMYSFQSSHCFKEKLFIYILFQNQSWRDNTFI